MEKNNRFFDYLIFNDLLKGNYLQVDLTPHKDTEMHTLPNLADCLEFPYLEDFVRCGYVYEIRMNRYFVILVDEFNKVKKDIKNYVDGKGM